MNSNITPEMLIRYLDNEATAEERLLIEAELADPVIDAQLSRLRLAQRAMQHYGRSKDVANIRKQMLQEQQPVQAGGKVRWMRTAMRIAAAVILLLVVAGVVQYSLLDKDRLYYSKYEAFSPGTVRAEGKMSPIADAYRRRDYQAAMDLYRRKESISGTDHFIAGQAFLASGDALNAIAAFQQQLSVNAALDFKPYQDDAEYFLALAYLKAGEINKALPLFEKINRQSSHAYHREVGNWYLMKLQWLERK